MQMFWFASKPFTTCMHGTMPFQLTILPLFSGSLPTAERFLKVYYCCVACRIIFKTDFE